jgi:hypothetical protein
MIPKLGTTQQDNPQYCHTFQEYCHALQWLLHNWLLKPEGPIHFQFVYPDLKAGAIFRNKACQVESSYPGWLLQKTRPGNCGCRDHTSMLQATKAT